MASLLEIGERIAAQRKSRGLSQAELGRKAGSSRATIDALENARLGEIGFRKLTAILAVLGLELELREAKSQRPTLEDLLKENLDGDD